ncbi:immunity protein Tsi6 family protein [Photobacterium kasasachensis]|uniref:immunity protein Tsi6 family protein n=1 Tax=Photobacterium kasasachensis TaxID=2910240 RepID=UPI003D124168
MANRFMTLNQQQLWINTAIDLTRERLGSDSQNSDLYNYILNQLEYIGECIRDKSLSRERLSDVNVGQLAVREFESIDREYSNSLKKVYFIVHYMKEGNKVPLLDESGNIVKG